MSDDEYSICPYNSNHCILQHRMANHLIKCRKTYKGPPLETCAFNATHLVHQGKMHEHLETCQAYHNFNRPLYAKMGRKTFSL